MPCRLYAYGNRPALRCRPLFGCHRKKPHFPLRLSACAPWDFAAGNLRKRHIMAFPRFLPSRVRFPALLYAKRKQAQRACFLFGDPYGNRPALRCRPLFGCHRKKPHFPLRLSACAQWDFAAGNLRKRHTMAFPRFLPSRVRFPALFVCKKKASATRLLSFW